MKKLVFALTIVFLLVNSVIAFEDLDELEARALSPTLTLHLYLHTKLCPL